MMRLMDENDDQGVTTTRFVLRHRRSRAQVIGSDVVTRGNRNKNEGGWTIFATSLQVSFQ